jgi:hypothetical protein
VFILTHSRLYRFTHRIFLVTSPMDGVTLRRGMFYTPSCAVNGSYKDIPAWEREVDRIDIDITRWGDCISRRRLYSVAFSTRCSTWATLDVALSHAIWRTAIERAAVCCSLPIPRPLTTLQTNIYTTVGFSIGYQSRFNLQLCYESSLNCCVVSFLCSAVQIGPGTHPGSCTMGTGSFPGVKRPGPDAKHSPPSSAEVRKGRAITLPTLWATPRPVTGTVYLLYYSYASAEWKWVPIRKTDTTCVMLAVDRKVLVHPQRTVSGLWRTER